MIDRLEANVAVTQARENGKRVRGRELDLEVAVGIGNVVDLVPAQVAKEPVIVDVAAPILPLRLVIGAEGDRAGTIGQR